MAVRSSRLDQYAVGCNPTIKVRSRIFKIKPIAPIIDVPKVELDTPRVIGETNNLITSVTGRIPAQPAGEHLLDVITRAAGLRDQGQDLWVTLERHNKPATVPFGALLYEPGNNIWAWPGETTYLYKEPQTFLAFGATGAQGQFQFSAGTASSAWRMTLAEGIGAASGLLDLQADPGSVYLFRREPLELDRRCSRVLLVRC